MQFIHKFHDYHHQIHGGVVHMMPGAGQAYVPVQTAPLLVAHFDRTRPLRILGDYGEISAETTAYVWRELARQFFDGKDSSKHAHEPHGAYRTDGVTTATDGEDDNVFFHGSQREFFYGTFDTADEELCPPEFREAFEAVLSGDAEACKRVSEALGYAGSSALRPTTDIRSGEMVILDKLLAGGYGEFSAQTPEGMFITGIGLATARYEPRERAVAAEPVKVGWPEGFPWPNFKDLDKVNHLKRAKIICETVVLTGLDPSRVLAFELEGLAQGATIERLTKLIADLASTPPVVEQAKDEDETPEVPVLEMSATVA